MADGAPLPVHIGFIIDGNRRWAADRGLASKRGHLEGYHTLKTVLLDVLNRGVRYASIYAFSTENWTRTKSEVAYLMNLFVKALNDDVQLFIEQNVRVRILGSRERLSATLIAAIDRIESMTHDLQGGHVLICLNYGGQQEIANACKRAMEAGVSAREMTIESIEQFLYAPDIPSCDMIVRTGGERRLSNFMLWRSAYSELMFIDKYWPDMTKRDVTRILKEYASRSRRFGG